MDHLVSLVFITAFTYMFLTIIGFITNASALQWIVWGVMASMISLAFANLATYPIVLIQNCWKWLRSRC